MELDSDDDDDDKRVNQSKHGHHSQASDGMVSSSNHDLASEIIPDIEHVLGN